jgi:hypothetical protein
MASHSRKKRNRRAVRGGLGQRIAVGLSTLVLVLCAASITFGLFVRKIDDDGGTRPLRVALLNGTGIPGIAGDAEAELLRLGVEVTEVGNAERFDYRESILVARKRGGEVALLGTAIGCGHVVEQLDRGAAEDATLILGADYRSLKLGWSREKGLADP